MRRRRQSLAGFASRRRYSSKTHAEGFGSWTLPPMVGSDGGPKTIVVRIPELPSYNPIDPGLSLPKKIPLPLAPLASWRFKSLFSPSSSTSRDLRSVALQSLVAGRHRHGLPRDATATFNIRVPRSPLVAGRDSHFQDPRSAISAGGGTPPARSAAGRDSHFQCPRSAIHDLFDPRSSIRGATEAGGGTPPARSAAGRVSHFQYPRSAITTGGGTPPARFAAGRDSHFQCPRSTIHDLRR